MNIPKQIQVERITHIVLLANLLANEKNVQKNGETTGKSCKTSYRRRPIVARILS
jgi:hypothetical protein